MPTTDIVTTKAALVPEVVTVETTITKPEALKFTDEINRAHRDVAGCLADLAMVLAAARDRCVWEPLGFTTFATWAEHELEMGKSRAYQLAEHGVVLAAIREVTRSTMVELPERVTRGWKKHLEVVLDYVGELTEDLPDDVVATAVLQAVPLINDHVARENLVAAEARASRKTPPARLSRAEHAALRLAQAEEQERDRVKQLPMRMLLSALTIRGVLDELGEPGGSDVRAAVEVIFQYVDALPTRVVE